MKKAVKTSEIIFKIPGICGKKLYSCKDVELVHLSLDAGKQMSPHTMPMKVIFYVLEGSIDVVINNEKHSLLENEFIEAPVGANRFTTNNSTKTARILVIKHPMK